MNTLDFILKKFNLSFDDRTRMPIEIPNFGRNLLASLLHELDFKTGVEIGVAYGRYSRVLADANPQMKLYGVDPYLPYGGYKDYKKQSTFEDLVTQAERRLAGCPNYEFIKEFSTDAVKKFEDKSLDFVYIDGNHEFSYVASDITLWSRKLKPGGIVSGHDYARMKKHDLNHVHKVINAYTQSYGIRPWFVLGREATDEGLVRDKPRSWMWVK